MEDLFRPSVDGIKELVNQQLTQLDSARMTARTIFLSGGFSQSPYLFKEVQQIARNWRCDLLRGDDR
jgi:hypothetical protein